MDENNFSSISNADTLEKMGEFWDTHDFTDFDTPDTPTLSLRSHVLCRLSWNCFLQWRNKHGGVV